jgi:L,D-transpeptidase YcbB
MKLRGLVAVVVMSGVSYAAVVLPALSKGKEDWLTQEAFKRAQGQETEQEGSHSPGDGIPSFDGEEHEEPEVFTPGRKKTNALRFRSLSDEEWLSAEPQVIAPRKSAASEEDIFDPEPDQSVGKPKSPDDGFGTYEPPKLVPLNDPSLIAATLLDPMAAAVLRQLREGEAPAVTEQQRDVIISIYRFNNFKPLWITPQGISERAKSVLSVLAKAEEEGLNAENYAVPRLAAFSDDLSGMMTDLAALASLEIGLTAATVRYAEHLHSGRLVPKQLSGYYDLKPPVLNLAQLLYTLSTHAAPQDYLASLAPPHPAYGEMKAALAELRSNQSQEEPVPAGERVKRGERSSRVPIVRKRMLKHGYLTEDGALAWMLGHPADELDAVRDHELVLDKELSKALKAFQEERGIKQTGSIDEATVDALNTPAIEQNVAKLVLSMERMRWLPRQLGDRYILVNQPAFELHLVEGERVSWTTKVIIGKPETQTYVFSDQMETVVLNPYWNVPKSIVTQEMLPKLADDPYYLDDKRFEVLNTQGQRVSSASVDWWSYGDTVPFDVRQPPGNDNALGRIKFLFPNSHDIYMHDTPAKKLFAKTTRAFSHGCVRVEDPRRLAEYVLGWERSRIDEAIASGRNEPVKLTTPIPVHLNYFTAWPDANGRVAYHPDIYERDARLEEALGTLTVASN